ncbi:MAG: PAS domain S-box protein [Solirubrobacteraceae bacterium]
MRPPDSLRVLIVHDRAEASSALAGALEAAGTPRIDVRQAATFAAAAGALVGERLDVVMLDLDAVGLEGLERLVDLAPEAAVIALSGREDVELASRALAAGAQDFLVRGSGASAVHIRHAVLLAHMHNLAEQATRRLASIIDDSPEAIVGVGIDGVITSWNGAAEDLYGYSAEEAVGREIVMLASSDEQRDEIRGLMSTVWHGHRIVDFETTRRRRDGSRIDVSLTISPMRGSGGRVVGTVSVGRDVSDRKRAERARERAQAELLEQRELLANVFDGAPIGMAIGAVDGRFLRVNRAFCEIVGHSESELLALGFEGISHPDDLEASIEAGRRLVAGTENRYQMVKRYIHRDGHVIWINLYVSLIRDEDGTPLLRVTQFEDISVRRRVEMKLAERERQLSEAQTLASIGSWEWDLSQPHQAWSDELCRIYGYPLGFEPTLEEYLSIVHPDDREIVIAGLERARSGGGSDNEYRIVRPEGEVRVVHGRRYGRAGEGGRVTHLFGTVQDITDRKRAELAVLRERDHSAAIIAAMSDGYALSVDGTITEVNDALCELTGFSREELVGAYVPWPFWPPEAIEDTLAMLERGGGDPFEVTMIRRDGARFPAEVRARPARNPDGSVLGWVSTIRDISERRRYETELERLATHDPLTGLPNHRLFHQRLEQEVASAVRHERPLSVALIDIDRFKSVNDRFGHLVGDRTLEEVARRLSAVVRQGEMLARVGGEEFAWILPESDGDRAVLAAERARRAVSSEPLEPVGAITISIGVAELDESHDRARMYQRADASLYEAKRTGRDRTVRFNAAPPAETHQ